VKVTISVARLAAALAILALAGCHRPDGYDHEQMRECSAHLYACYMTCFGQAKVCVESATITTKESE